MKTWILLMQKGMTDAQEEAIEKGLSLPSKEYDPFLKGPYEAVQFPNHFKDFRLTDSITARIFKWIHPNDNIIFVFFGRAMHADFNRWILLDKFPGLVARTAFSAADVRAGKVLLVSGWADPKRRVAYAFESPGNIKHEWAHLEGFTHGPASYFQF